MPWILVTEKLPSDDSDLMISVYEGDETYAVIDRVFYKDGTWYKDIPGRQVKVKDFYGDVKVIAWMPYPRPYIPQGE